MYEYIYIYTHTYIHTYIHTCMHAYIHTCICNRHIYRDRSTRLSIYACLSVCLSLRVYETQLHGALHGDPRKVQTKQLTLRCRKVLGNLTDSAVSRFLRFEGSISSQAWGAFPWYAGPQSCEVCFLTRSLTCLRPSHLTVTSLHAGTQNPKARACKAAEDPPENLCSMIYLNSKTNKWKFFLRTSLYEPRLVRRLLLPNLFSLRQSRQSSSSRCKDDMLSTPAVRSFLPRT